MTIADRNRIAGRNQIDNTAPDHGASLLEHGDDAAVLRLPAELLEREVQALGGLAHRLIDALDGACQPFPVTGRDFFYVGAGLAALN